MIFVPIEINPLCKLYENGFRKINFSINWLCLIYFSPSSVLVWIQSTKSVWCKRLSLFKTLKKPFLSTLFKAFGYLVGLAAKITRIRANIILNMFSFFCRNLESTCSLLHGWNAKAFCFHGKLSNYASFHRIFHQVCDF